jgi:hypothetical protein
MVDVKSVADCVPPPAMAGSAPTMANTAASTTHNLIFFIIPPQTRNIFGLSGDDAPSAFAIKYKAYSTIKVKENFTKPWRFLWFFIITDCLGRNTRQF